MSNITTKNIQDAINSGKTAQEIVESLGQNNVSSGSKVTVVSDPNYPYEGIVGTVRGAPSKAGFAKVEFPSGQTVDLAVNQLIIVGR